MIHPTVPALVLAPMEGVTDAPMRAVQGECGSFTHAVSEFLRISQSIPTKRTFFRHIPELSNGSVTPSGLPVQVQLLGGHAGRMAEAAAVAVSAGAKAVDLNFGCPAPTVNRHDGGATLLKYPHRIREIVAAVRDAVPRDIPVSAKLRLGWDSLDAIDENAEMAAEGGANWLTIHGRTRFAGYAPPIHWGPIGRVRERLRIPVIANGDIWNLEGFRRCREQTGCRHFMIGRGALANPLLPHQVAVEMGIATSHGDNDPDRPFDWLPLLKRFVVRMGENAPYSSGYIVRRIKQWLNYAASFGTFDQFESIKRETEVERLFAILKNRSVNPQTNRITIESVDADEAVCVASSVE